MGSETPEIPRTPPAGSRLNHSQPSNVSGTPHSQTASSLGSHNYRRESVDPALQLEWSKYSATGVACDAMLTLLYPSTMRSPNEATSEELRLRLEDAISMLPEATQYGPIADICNDILDEYYEENPPTKDQPARWFIPLGSTVFDSEFAQRKPDVVVVICDLWEEYARSQLEDDNSISKRKGTKEWKKVFPDWGAIDSSIRNVLTNPESLKARHLSDPQLRQALEIHPPWECIVAIMEFKVPNSPEATVPIPASGSSTSTNISEKTCPRSKGNICDVTQVKLRKKIPGSSPIAERGSTPPAPNNSQNNSARKSFISPLAPRKTLLPEVQLLSYFCEVMSAARYRDWTSGVIISGVDFSLVTCDREGAIKSAPTNLRTAAGANIFSRWVVAVGSGTLVQSGFAKMFGTSAGQIEGVDFSIPDHAKRASEGAIQLKFGKQHYQQYGAFGRGTTLHCVDITKGDETIQGVCKISWPAATRDSEYDLIKQARAVDPDHLPEVICTWDIENNSLPSRMLRKDCPLPAVEHEPRVLRIVAFPFYAPIHELEGDEFLAALWDVILCNVKLYEANSVHHRDPSVNNMMYRRDEDGQAIGILSDFDLAISMTSGESSSLHRSGTAPFMALDLLKPNACQQELAHDFESALYIMLWVALGYKGWKPPTTGDPLSDWRRGTWRQICNAKTVFINTDIEKDLLGLVTPQYQVLCKKISELHQEISLRAQSKMQEILARRHGKNRPAVGPMTSQEFFNIIGPPPPGREAYFQIN